MSATRNSARDSSRSRAPFDQPRIEIDPDDARAALDELLRQPTARTADVEDALAANVARHRQDRRSVIRDLDRIDGGVVRVQIRHLLVVGQRATSIVGHEPIMPTRTPTSVR